MGIAKNYSKIQKRVEKCVKIELRHKKKRQELLKIWVASVENWPKIIKNSLKIDLNDGKDRQKTFKIM